MYFQYQNYIQNLIEKIQKLEIESQDFQRQSEVKFKLLKEENEKLKEVINGIKPIHIENINYKIQELDVKELSGTLNIGMTALDDPEKIKQWIQDSDEKDIQFNDMEQNSMKEKMEGEKTNE